MKRASPSEQKWSMKKIMNRGISLQEPDMTGKSFCRSCNRPYNKKYFYRHKCINKLKPRGVNKIVLENTAANETFGKSILSHFRETGPSKVCFKDPVWRTLGLEEYKKLAGIEAKERQAKVRTMTFMNSIATLYGLFSTEAKKKQLDLEFSDMFRPKYLVFLKYVLEDESLKDYNRHMIIYALKNAAEKLKGLYYINDDRQSAAEINELQTVLNIILPPIVNPIVNAQRRRRRRREILRLPQNLPSLSSITKIKNYIELETEGILEDSENNFDFVALRRLTQNLLFIKVEGLVSLVC